MKKYLFSLRAMLVDTGLMFVLMYGEVSAEGELEAYCGDVDSQLTFCKVRVLKLNIRLEMELSAV